MPPPALHYARSRRDRRRAERAARPRVSRNRSEVSLMSVAPEPVHDLYMSSQAVTAKGIQGRLINPALIEHARQRRLSFENRLADRITSFSGSMQFVYLHAIWFTVWIASGVERYPYGLLTMIVSLEAIFLSTFVMISQN